MRNGCSRKWFFILILSVLTLSCSTDFEPHIMSEPIPVVYGLINPKDSLYHVRLSKSFVGPGNAYTYAQNPDSIYYDNAQVFLESRRFNGKKIDRVELLPKEIEAREEGVFARTPNIIYETDFRSIRLRPEILAEYGIPYEVDLLVQVEIPGQEEYTESITRLRSEPGIINPKGNFRKVYFYGELPFFMEWTHDAPNTYFEIKVVMRYQEILEYEERDVETFWVLKGIQVNEHSFGSSSRALYSYYFRPENFYSQIRAAIPRDPEVKSRRLQNIDFIILTSDGSVRDYHEISEIADDYHGATFSNITNGLGLFSSFNTKGVYNQRLGQRELDSLALGIYTRHLRFNRWQ